MLFNGNISILVIISACIWCSCCGQELSTFGLTSTGSTYHLSPGESVQLDFNFDFSSSNASSKNVTFQADILSFAMINTSNAVINYNTKTIAFTLTSALFSGHGFGDYSCRFSLFSTSSDTHSLDITLAYEEIISNLQVSGNSFQKVGVTAIAMMSLNSGSNIRIVWYENGQQNMITSDSGNGTRQIPQSISLTSTGEVNVTVNASNSVSFAVTWVIVYNYYHINGFNVSGTPGTLGGDSVITVKIVPGADLPQGPLSLKMSYGDGNLEIRNLSSIDPSLQSGLTFTNRFSSVGTYTVSMTILSKVDSKVYTETIHVYETISVIQVDCSSYQRVGVAVAFNITIPAGSDIDVKWRFNDVLTFQTSYASHGFYVENFDISSKGTIHVANVASNPVSEVFHNLTFQNVHGINGITLIGDKGLVNTDVNIILRMETEALQPQGHFSIRLDFGDSTSSEVITISSENPIFTSTGLIFTHKYNVARKYTVEANVTSPIETKAYTSTVHIMEPITDIQLNCSLYQRMDVAVAFNVTIPAGSDINVEWYVNDISTFNTSYASHGFYIENFDISSKGTVHIKTVASNLFSEASHNLTFQNVYGINGITLIGDKALVNTDVNITLRMDTAALLPQGQLSVRLDFGDSTSSEVIAISSENVILTTTGVIFTHQYNVKGKYTVEANVTSPIETKMYTSTAHIMEPITDIQVDCSSHQRMGVAVAFNVTIPTSSEIDVKWYVNDVLTFQTSYASHGFYVENFDISSKGIVHIKTVASNIFSEASHNLTFQNVYGINGITLNGDKALVNTDVNITLRMDTAALLPQGQLSVRLDFGDSTSSEVITISSENVILTTTGVIFTHQYNVKGKYTVEANVTSPIETKMYTSTAHIMEPITDIQVDCSSHQRMGVAVAFNVTIPTSSEIDVKWYVNDVLTFQTSYASHGFYVENFDISSKGIVHIKTVASNIFSEASHNLTFQNVYGINGITLNGDKALVNTDVNITLRMDTAALLPQGQLSVRLDFGDSTSSEVMTISSENVILTTTGVIFTHQYNVKGKYTVEANVTSPIETKTYTSNVHIMEPITDIQVDCSSYQRMDVAVVFNVTIPAGSDIDVKWYVNDVSTFQTSYASHGFYVENFDISSKWTVRVKTVASNLFSEAYHNLTFKNIYGINGITVLGDEAIVNTDVNIILRMDNAALQPQGLLSICLDFGDSTSSEAVKIYASNATLKTTGLIFTHQYNVEGNYTVETNVTSPIETKTYTSFVQIMEPITDIQISCDTFQTFGIPVVVTVNLTDGYNIIIHWFVDGQPFPTSFHAGKGARTYSINLLPTTTGDLNVTALANNAVSGASTSVGISYLYSINGFVLVVYPSTIYKNATIFLKRTGSANLPQGSLSIVLQYGDGNMTSLNLSASDPSFSHPGYRFTHHYSAEGYHNVVANITSKIDFKSLSSTIPIVEPIENISVLCYPENHYVGNSIVVNVTINNGFDVKTSWYVNGRYRFQIFHAGKGMRVYSNSRRYSEKGKLVIKVKASNLFWTKPYHEVGEELVIEANLTDGFNVTTTWNIGTSLSEVLLHNGTGSRNFSITKVINEKGPVAISVTAINVVSQDTSNYTTYFYHRINGFYLSTTVASTVSDAKIYLKTSPTTQVPQGVINITFDFGDETKNMTSLEFLSATLTDPNLLILHRYEVAGNYTVTATLTSPLGIENISVEVEVMEPIFGIQFECESYVEVGQELIIDATLFGGFRVTTEWYIGTAPPIVVLDDRNGTRNFQVRYNVSEIGLLAVRVNASNDVSHASNSTTIYYLYAVNGFNVSHGIYSNLEVANVSLTLSTAADLPMGLITVFTDFGDGNNNLSVINGSDLSFTTTGLHFSHHYVVASNYSIVITLTSEINSVNLTTGIKILEPIYGIEFICPTYIEVGEEIEIHATLFGGHEVITEWVFGNRSKSEIYHHGSGTRTFTVTHNVPGSGKVNITVFARSPVSKSSNATTVFYYYGVNGFLISKPQTISSYNVTDVNIWLDSNASKPMGDISIDLMFGDGNISSISLDSENASLYDPGLLFSHMYQMFGDYVITAQISSHINTVNYSTGAEMLEPIDGIEVSCTLYNMVGNTLPLLVKVNKGTKLQIKWDFGGADTLVQNITGSGLRSYEFMQAVHSTGEINVTLEAGNTVSNVKNWIITYYFHLINGFYFDHNVTVQTKQVASIFLKMATSAHQPQGVVEVNLFFGDGNSTTFNVSSDDQDLISNGMYFDYVYYIQGVYHIEAGFVSSVGSANISSDIEIWDKINVELNYTRIAKVGEEVHFDFIHVPNSNFMYQISYGDGDSKSNTEHDLYRNYDFSSWTKVYKLPSSYDVQLIAWNPLYKNIFNCAILVEYPLLDDIITLLPASDTIPLPDGTLEFVLEVTQPSPIPSNVICSIDYGDGEASQQNVPVNMAYGTPDRRTYVFKSHGLKNVTFHCRNSVSSIFRSSKVNVLLYDLQDIMIFYENPVNMNMTLESRTPTEDNRHSYRAVSIPVNVTFNIYLLGCSRLPNNIEMKWKFGDETPREISRSTQLFYYHQYKSRGTFQIRLKIIDHNKNDTDLRFLGIQTGTISFTVSPDKGDLRETIYNLTATGLLGENSQYTFYGDSTELLQDDFFIFDNATNFTAAWSHIQYNKYGYYIPSVQGSNETLVETVYWEFPVLADLKLDDDLTLTVPAVVPLPPGSVEYIISIPSGPHGYRPFVFCTISPGDEVDRTLRSALSNITSSYPFYFNYTYVAIGYPVLNITCRNSISTKTWAKPITVRNTCFEVKGIFDRQYSMSDCPMPVWTSDDFYISNRMGVTSEPSCSNAKPVFQWEIYRTNESGVIDVNYQRIYIESDNGTLFLRAGTLEPGSYFLKLTVNLTSTFIFEYMYIRFIKPKPFAYIIGGSKTTIRPSSFIILDALEQSHIANSGYGNTDGLSFVWSCQESNGLTASPSHSQGILNGSNVSTSSPASSGCQLGDQSRGIAKLNLDGYEDVDFSVTVTVIENSSQDEFTQTISVVSTTSPELAINCTLNCGQKIAISTKATFIAWCKSCADENATLNHEWRLWMKNEQSLSYELVQGFPENTTTGTKVQTLAIPENVLVAGVQYMLTLNANYSEEEGSAEVYTQFTTNFPPYGGSCNYSIQTTDAALLSVRCKEWADEGFHLEQNYARDLQAKRPLVYQYETKTKRNLTHGIEDVVNIIYRGSESSITGEYIQVGDSSFGYTVYVVVKIFDLYGDFTEVQSQGFRVPPPSETQPKSETDLTTLRTTYDKFLVDYTERKRGGNEMSAIRLIGSVASMFKNFSNADTTTTENEIMTGAVQAAHVDDTTSPIVEEYQNKIAHMLDLLRLDLQTHCSSNQYRFSLPDLQLIYSVIDAITRLQPYITFDVVVNTTRLLDNLVQCFDKVTDLDPFPVGYVQTTYETAKAMHRIINRLLDVMLPNHLQDLTIPINKAEIKEVLVRDAERQKHQEALLWAVNVSTLIDYTDLDNKAGMLVDVRQHFRIIQEQQVEMARTYFPIMQRILRRMQVVILRTIVLAERHIMDRDVVSVITEKITVDSIKNRTDEYFVGIQPSNGTFEQLTDVIIAMKINYFRKNPFIYGVNASTLTSGVSTFDIGDDLKLDVKLANNGNFKYQKFLPLINPEYPEQMIYFTFDVVNDDDAAIIFMNPDGFDINNPVNFTLYTFYVRSETWPTSELYDFIKTVGMHDWENIGFKIFLEQGLCPKGPCYLGVKPETAPDYSQYIPTKMRRKREAVNETTTPASVSNQFVPVIANFSLVVVTTGCRSWNDSQNAWSSESCMVLEMSSVNDTVCRCSGNTFSTTFYVPPNMINFLTVFKKFDATNAFVYGPLIVLFVIYVIVALILRREDKKDLTRWAVHFLVDHDAEDQYFYLLTIQTGMRRGAGTKSNVNFVIVGNEEDSGIRVLADGIKEGFGVASINRYFMGTKEPLGELKYLRIWHDNSGKGAEKSWYLNRVIIDDLQEKDRYVFLCEKWLSLDEDDGMIERVLPVSTKENVNAFKTLMNENAQLNITDHHLWVALLLRPNISRFTRVQRLATLMVLLLLVMIANAMFFRSSSEDTSSFQMEVGFLRFSLSTLYVSIIGVVITTPPILFVIIAFRKSKLRKTKRAEPSLMKCDQQKKSEKYDVSNSNHCLQSLNEDIMFADSNLVLPFWTVYFAWIVLVLAAAACAFFLILYSMEWGKDKSEEWLSSFLLSFVESILFVDPLKVVFVSLMFATIFKSMKEQKPPSIDLGELHKASGYYHGDSRQSFLALVNDILKKNEPPSEEELKILRQKRQEEKKARKATYNILIYTLYIFVLYSASYLQRDLRSFNYKWNMDNYLIANSGSQLGFSAINETKDFIAWINRTLIPTFYPEQDYRGVPLSVVDQKWFGDHSSIRVGPARLRQLRSKREICKVWSITWPKDCVEKYAELSEETSPYCLGWHTYNKTACSGTAYENTFLTANAWKYTDAKDIWGISILGDYNSYSGGGYILEFTKNRAQAVAMLNELMKYYWIDRATRAIFLEFTIYNPNSNLFAYAIFLCEFPETGGTLIWTDTQSFRPVLSSNEVGAYAILCYIVIVAYLVAYLIRIIVKSATKGCCAFFKVPWNIVDFLIMCLGFACIGVYIVRYIDAQKAMQMYADDILTGTNRFINFGHIVIWDNVFNAFFSVLVFISTLKILRILGYNRKFTEIISVVTNASSEIAGFSVVFIVMFSSFVLFGYFLFGVHLQGYKTVFATCSTLANTFIGKNKLDTLMAAAPKTAQFYYFTYMVTVIMTLLTMFAAILNKSISDVKAETSQYIDTIGITDICWRSAKNFFSMFFKFRSKKSEQNNKENENFKKMNSKWSGNVEASNVLALIRHTFNDFSDLQSDKNIGRVESSKLDNSIEREKNPIKLYPKSDQNEMGKLHILKQYPLKTAEFSSKEMEDQRNYSDSKMHMYF